MNEYKKWVESEGILTLIFCPFGDDEILAKLWKAGDDWVFHSPLLHDEKEVDCICCCEHDAKLEVEEQIYEHYEGERDYYNALMEKFEEKEA